MLGSKESVRLNPDTNKNVRLTWGGTGACATVRSVIADDSAPCPPPYAVAAMNDDGGALGSIFLLNEKRSEEERESERARSEKERGWERWVLSRALGYGYVTLVVVQI